MEHEFLLYPLIYQIEMVETVGYRAQSDMDEGSILRVPSTPINIVLPLLNIMTDAYYGATRHIGQLIETRSQTQDLISL